MSWKFNQQKLKSGLTLVSAPSESESITVLCLIRAGSREETEGQYGVAHFLEHFVFKGTKKFPKVNDTTKAIDAIGGKMNAFTWYDITGFWVKVASDQWQKGLEVVSQLTTEPLLEEKELVKEKGTIIEEIKMYEDDHRSKALNEFEDMVFPGSPLGRQVLGTVKSITDMKIDDLKTFRKRWYFPENMVVVVTGKLPEPQKLVEEIEQKFSSLSGKKQSFERFSYNEVFTQKAAKVVVSKRKTEQAHLVLGVRAYAASDERMYSVWVLNQLLGGNMSSRLWNEVREKRGLAYYVGSTFYGHQDQGVMLVRAGVRLKDLKEAVEVIKGELEKLTNKEVGAAELKMAKDGVKGNLKLDLEDSQEVAELIAQDWSLVGKIRSVEEIVKGVDKVTTKDILAVAKELFKKERLNLSVVGDIAESEEELLAALE